MAEARFLFVGLGAIGQRHLRNLRTLLGFDAEILAYRTRGLTHVLTDGLQIEEERGLHERYDIRAFDDMDEALATGPTAAFICNPTSLHLQVAMAAASAGCDLFIEKPLSHSYDGVEDLIGCVEERNLVALVGYQWRFHPCLQRARSFLEDGRIGRVLAVRAEVGEYLPDWHRYEDYRSTYAARADLGGGALLSQIHEMDYLYWFFGLPKRVFCVGGHLSRLDIDVEDVASTLMTYEVDRNTIPVHLQQDYLRRPPSRNCQIIGDEGRIEIDLRGGTVDVFDATGELADTHTTAVERDQLFVDEIRHFLACLRQEERPVVTVRDGAQSLRMALAAKRSLETGQVVELAR